MKKSCDNSVKGKPYGRAEELDYAGDGETHPEEMREGRLEG